MFAMTTDSVGVIIPEIIKEFHLSMTVGGAFHYAAMSGIALRRIFPRLSRRQAGQEENHYLGIGFVRIEFLPIRRGQVFHVFCNPPRDLRSGDRRF